MTPPDAVDPRHDDGRNGGPEGARQREPREHHHVRKIGDPSVRSSPPTWVPAEIRVRGAKGERHVRGVARWPLAVHPATDAFLGISESIPWVITHQPSGYRLVPLGFRTEASARAFADDVMKRAGSPGFAVRQPDAHLELATVIAEALHARRYEATITAHTSPGAPA